MPIVTVIVAGGEREIPFTRGASLRDILDATPFRVRSGCQGNGACGLCQVAIESGAGSPPTATERLVLPPDGPERAVRLACQFVPEGDVRLRIVGRPRETTWRALGADHVPCTLSPAASDGADAAPGAGHGLAIDVGTTHVSASLWALDRRERLLACTGSNPQSGHGSDVVTRLQAAADSAEGGRALARLPLEAVSDALRWMGARAGVEPGQVTRVAVVGNTAMLTLLTGGEPRTLLDPRSWTTPIATRLRDPGDWIRRLGVDPAATMDLVPPLAGFVGSDLLAGVVGTGLAERPGSLLVDLGTNAEIALWDGAVLWVTSAAGGPAFEGSRARCGMPAEPGAIFRVDRPGGGALRCRVIGGGTAIGLCGSGLVDLISCLRAAGDLSETGRFTTPDPSSGFGIRADPPLRLSAADVDAFQRAKAAIAGGVRVLLDHAGIRARDLARVCVAGEFGLHLDVANAAAVGLLPAVPADRVELCGNTALAGCERLLTAPATADAMARLRDRATVVNLARCPEFEDRFLEGLYLRPNEGVER